VPRVVLQAGSILTLAESRRPRGRRRRWRWWRRRRAARGRVAAGTPPIRLLRRDPRRDPPSTACGCIGGCWRLPPAQFKLSRPPSEQAAAAAAAVLGGVELGAARRSSRHRAPRLAGCSPTTTLFRRPAASHGGGRQLEKLPALLQSWIVVIADAPGGGCCRRLLLLSSCWVRPSGRRRSGPQHLLLKLLLCRQCLLQLPILLRNGLPAARGARTKWKRSCPLSARSMDAPQTTYSHEGHLQYITSQSTGASA
jgi:hypothetical protein